MNDRSSPPAAAGPGQRGSVGCVAALPVAGSREGERERVRELFRHATRNTAAVVVFVSLRSRRRRRRLVDAALITKKYETTLLRTSALRLRGTEEKDGRLTSRVVDASNMLQTGRRRSIDANR